jgi:ubiquinone/menaquinone biosynthesis C-methylase UbiE
MALHELAHPEELPGHALRAARTYGAAADHYGLGSLSFWNRFGAATVSRLPLEGGQSVLDLCCGAGGSAIPAARAVGPGGNVLGIDVAEPLLEQARAKAVAEHLPNIEFRCGDAISTGLPAASFDAVVCVFGVFFAPDMPAFAAEMWRLLRPGGVLAITTWGPGVFEPANAIFWESVRSLEPSLYKSFNPWDEITTPEALADLCARAGILDVEVEAVPARHDLASPARFWDVVLGSGYRATVDALGQDQQDVLRQSVLTELSLRRVTTLRTDVVYARAIRRTD